MRPSEKLEETRVDRKVDDGLDDPTLLVVLAKSGPFISNREQRELQLLLSLSAFLPHSPSLLAERDQLGSFSEGYGGNYLKHIVVNI